MFTSIKLPTEIASTEASSTGEQVRQQDTTVAATLTPGLNGFCWPSPLSVLYSKAEAWSEPQACELEGLNGTVRRCALVSLSPADEAIQIQVEHAKAPISMAFSQFRRLTLTQPIFPQDLLSAEHFPNIQNRQATAEYHLHLADGSVRSGLTVGYVETSFGLFVFTPLDNRGAVERAFIPRNAFASVSLSDHAGQLNTQLAGATANVMAHSSPAITHTLKLDDYLADAAVVSREQLMLALDHQSKMPAVRVGEALLKLGFVSEAQLQQALAEQSGRSAKPLGELLIQAGALTRRDLNTALARKMGYPMVDVTRFPIEPAALEKIPLTTARRLMALPLLTRGELTVVASPNPTRREFLEELEFLLRGRVIATLGDEDQILQTMTTAYDRLSQGNWPAASPATQDVLHEVPIDSVDLLGRMDLLDFGALSQSRTNPVNALATDADTVTACQNRQHNAQPVAESDGNLDRLVTTMILQAQRSGATGIHIEVPQDGDQLRIRFRKNGRLVPHTTLPHHQHAALVAHLKTMAHLDVFEQRRPQLGKVDFDTFSPLHQVRLCISTLPTANGLQDVVLKLLPHRTPLTLEQLDLSPETLEGLQHAISQPGGLVLSTGPVDSGKTTTLQAVLAALSSPERNIWRAQTHPVTSPDVGLDLTAPEVRQVQINPPIGWTYAAALRSFLQADADILMADELPDTETAQVAVEAALSGHLMLSTLPANSAATAVQELLAMGVNPFSLADALQAVMAQRLVGRFCQSCRSSEPAGQADIDELLDDYLHAFPEAQRPARQDLQTQWVAQYGVHGALHTYHATGCSHCQGSGMAGRVGVQELMCVTPGLRRLIQTEAQAEALVAEAFKDGKFRTLRQDGIAKVLAGLTSIDDIRAHTHD